MTILPSQAKSLWKFGGSLIVGIAVIIVGLQFTKGGGEVTKEAVIAKYIVAIRQENPDQIAKLLPDSHTITHASLSALIRDSGGKALETTQISAVPSESPQLEVVKLTGTYKKNGELIEFTNNLYLQKRTKRWYLLLGRDKHGLPTDAPSSKVD